MPRLPFPSDAPETSALYRLLKELHALHGRAGFPGTRRMEKKGNYSHTVVHQMFTRPRLPSFPMLMGVVGKIAPMVPGGDVKEIKKWFEELWVKAEAEDALGSVVQSKAEPELMTSKPVPAEVGVQRAQEAGSPPDIATAPAIADAIEYLLSWGISDPEVLAPALLRQIDDCRAHFENARSPLLYRPYPTFEQNRLDILLDGPDIKVEAKKTWNENDARVWRYVHQQLQIVDPGIHRPGRPNGHGAPGELRRLYRNLRVVAAAAATRIGPEPAVLRLIFAEGPVEVAAGSLQLGRVQEPPAGRILAAYENVSRHHATVGVEPDGSAWVRDEGSANGTFVNDTPVHGQQAPLSHGDRLRLGSLKGSAVARVELRSNGTP